MFGKNLEFEVSRSDDLGCPILLVNMHLICDVIFYCTTYGFANNQLKIGRISGVLEFSRKPDNPAPWHPGISGLAGLSAPTLGRIIRPGRFAGGLREAAGRTVATSISSPHAPPSPSSSRRSSSSSPETPRPLPLGVFGWIGCLSSLAIIFSKRLPQWMRV
jgi:hypothetical protein